MPSKEEMYTHLVKARKLCRRPECRPLCNQSKIDGGAYDYNQIGSWSLWQGNLDSKIVVVGRDWGSIADFRTLKGYPTSGIGISKTNRTLIELLQSIGITIGECKRSRVGGPLFFTNSILCIQPGKRSDPVKQVWANLCSKAFLRPLLEIIAPEIVITLSSPAISQSFRLSEFTQGALFLLLLTKRKESASRTAAASRLKTLERISILELTPESRNLAKKLLTQGPIPQKAALDALHIAIAVVHGMDLLITWNCTHIANAGMRNMIEAVCRSLGYEPPVICTPEELMEE